MLVAQQFLEILDHIHKAHPCQFVSRVWAIVLAPPFFYNVQIQFGVCHSNTQRQYKIGKHIPDLCNYCDN